MQFDPSQSKFQPNGGSSFQPSSGFSQSLVNEAQFSPSQTLFKTNNTSAVLDLSYDNHAQRIALCTLDRTIQLYTRSHVSPDQSFELASQWKAHDGPIYRIIFADPVFSPSLLATCSYDRKVILWQDRNGSCGLWNSNVLLPRDIRYESVQADLLQSSKKAAGESTTDSDKNGSGSMTTRGSDSVGTTYKNLMSTDSISPWYPLTQLVDSRDEVRDIAFAPSFWGLKLASVSADGDLRIYEALDQTKLHQWMLMEEFSVHSNLELHMARATKVASINEHTKGNSGNGSDEKYENIGLHCVSWRKSAGLSKFPAGELAVGTADGLVIVYGIYGSGRPLEQIMVLNGCDGHIVHDVAWAPNPGRNFEMIAAAVDDGEIRVWRIPDKNQNLTFFLGQEDTESGKKLSSLENIEPVRFSKDESKRSKVWRVEWNATGTMLVSTQKDGQVILWQPMADSFQKWTCVGNIEQGLST